MKENQVPSGHEENNAMDRIASAIRDKLGVDFTPEDRDGYQRFAASDKPSFNKACWVNIADDLSSAAFGNFITGEKHYWLDDAFEVISDEGLAERKAINDERRVKLEAQKVVDERAAASHAQSMLEHANPAVSHHSYLTVKNVKPHGLLQDGVTLLVPLYNPHGNVCSLQFIYPEGSKYFLVGGKTKGAYTTIGKPFSTNKLFVCEGWATGASLYQETGNPVIAALTANNLMDVCQHWSALIPESVEIVVAADNDHRTSGNPGLTKGKEAATAIGAKVIYPPVPCAHKDCRCTDFNDWVNCYQKKVANND